jgi:ketol-acid reductoisomerase
LHLGQGAALNDRSMVKAMEVYKKGPILENQFEAQLLESLLRERGIPCMVRSYYDTAFDGLYQTQKGWGYVSAPEEYLHEIDAILLELREGGVAADSDTG